MFEHLMNKYAVNQLGFYVKDAEKAALEHSELFGSGPFVVMERIVSEDVEFRGEASRVEMKVAYGQHGNLQIELIQVLSEEPNPYYEKGSYGLHHLSIWSDDPEQVVKDFEAAGYEVAMIMRSGGGLTVYYIDCREPWGLYIEVHKPIQRVWDMYAKMAEEWDGSDPVRKR